MRIVKLTKETTENILENMLKRSPTQYGTYEASVQEIIENVKTRKDAAVFEYTEKFDHAVLDASTVEVTQEAVSYTHLDVYKRQVQNPPSRPLTEQEMDDVYALPYMRAYHPSYEKRCV